MLGWTEIILILIIIATILYSRMFRVAGFKKAVGIEEMSDEDEIRIGKSLVGELSTEEETDERAMRILEGFHEKGNLRFPHCRLLRLQSSEVNAMALIGGQLLTTQGLMNLGDLSEEELAGILAHEIGHVELGHVREAFIRENRTKVLRAILTICHRTPRFSVDIAQQLAKLGISRTTELEADDFALELLSKADYSPAGLIRFFERAKGGKSRPDWLTFVSTHPALEERIERLERHLS